MLKFAGLSERNNVRRSAEGIYQAIGDIYRLDILPGEWRVRRVWCSYLSGVKTVFKKAGAAMEHRPHGRIPESTLSPAQRTHRWIESVRLADESDFGATTVWVLNQPLGVRGSK